MTESDFDTAVEDLKLSLGSMDDRPDKYEAARRVLGFNEIDAPVAIAARALAQKVLDGGNAHPEFLALVNMQGDF